MSIDELAAEIAKNNQGEQMAIEGYYLLLDEARKHGLPQDFIRQISEIISDEMNHSEILSRWVTYLTNIKPNTT